MLVRHVGNILEIELLGSEPEWYSDLSGGLEPTIIEAAAPFDENGDPLPSITITVNIKVATIFLDLLENCHNF